MSPQPACNHGALPRRTLTRSGDRRSEPKSWIESLNQCCLGSTIRRLRSGPWWHQDTTGIDPFTHLRERTGQHGNALNLHALERGDQIDIRLGLGGLYLIAGDLAQKGLHLCLADLLADLGIGPADRPRPFAWCKTGGPTALIRV